MADTLRSLLKKYGIRQSVVFEALGRERLNLDRYDDLMERSVKEVMLISKATGISFSELIGIEDKDISKIDKLLKKLSKTTNS
ncbi:MAG: hypothetical protein ACK5KL_15670 [Dysgonomonas sp.]